MRVVGTQTNEDRRSIQLSDVNLSVRASNCLRQMGLTTLAELANLSDAELLRIPNFGKKCLTEVRELLSSTEGMGQCVESKNESDELDFSVVKEPLTSTLLRSVQTLDLTTRAINALEDWGIKTVGELAQLTEIQLLARPNVGTSTVSSCKNALAQFDLSLRMTILNWPNKDELASILASRVQDDLSRMQMSAGTFEYIEEELCAAVKMSVRANAYAIVIRRTGWDGNQVFTLQELADDPNASGRSSPVTRERIRQVESCAKSAIQKKKLSMPLLEQAIALIEENAPLAASTLPSLLKRYELSQCGLGFKEINEAMKVFQIQWNLDCRYIDQELFLFPRDEADEIEFVWAILVKEAFYQDFVHLDEIECLNQYSNQWVSVIMFSGVNRIPTLEWLDRDQRIYWGFDRVNCGWNKIVNVCRKILTVAPRLPFERLATAVKRARTVKDCPSHDILKAMLRMLDEFDIVDEVVSRGANFKPDTLNQKDLLMIAAAKDVGTVTTFLKLREVLVRKGLSTNYAQVLMVISPLWVTTSRGKYRFIANEAQLHQLSLNSSIKPEEFQESRECLVEFVSAHKHLVSGTHRISGNSVKQGEWLLRDEQGNNLGKINVTGCVIRGLDGVFSDASIGVGATVMIDFSNEEFMATLFHRTFDQQMQDQC